MSENSITRLLAGTDLDPETLNGAVQSLALICALVITIPFGLMSSLNADFWESLDILATDCKEYGYNAMSTQMYAALRATIFSATGGLIMTAFFYLLKPKDIKKWWHKGRFFLMLMFSLTGISVIALICASNVYISITSYTAENYCTASSFPAVIGLGIFLITIFIICLILFI